MAPAPTYEDCRPTRRRSQLDVEEIDEVLGRCVQHRIDELTEGDDSLPHPARSRPVPGRAADKKVDEAFGRQFELRKEVRGREHCARCRPHCDPHGVDHGKLIDIEAGDPVGGDVKLVPEASNPLQTRPSQPRRIFELPALLAGSLPQQADGHGQELPNRVRCVGGRRSRSTGRRARAIVPAASSRGRVPGSAGAEGERVIRDRKGGAVTGAGV
ncbi:MAG: hypothetical protein ABIR68_04690 [Ilumatobacteraceae bacterium]